MFFAYKTIPRPTTLEICDGHVTWSDDHVRICTENIPTITHAAYYI